MHVPVNSPAGGAVRGGWPESCRSPRARSGHGKRPAPKPRDRLLQTSNAVAAAVAAGAEAAIGPVRVERRRQSRVRHDLSAERRGGNGEPHHNPDPPPHGTREIGPAVHREWREIGPEAIRHPYPAHAGNPAALTTVAPRQGGREICQARDGGVDVGAVEDAARDQAVPRQVAARRAAGRHQPDRPGRPNSPE